MVKLFIKLMEKYVMNPILHHMTKTEDMFLEMKDAHNSLADSPKRFHIMKEGLKRGWFDPKRMQNPQLLGSLLGIFTSIKDVRKNPDKPSTKISPADLKEFEEYLKDMGITGIGYTKVPARRVFKDHAILFSNAIVTSMEMDKKRIDTAPGPKAADAVHEIYLYLGRAMIKGARFLRKKGYAAYAGHPLMGLALYPPLAQRAGLGQLGTNGLIITPGHGPRVRLAAIFTNITNLSFNKENPHAWVAEYCKTCLICVRECLGNAIYPKAKIINKDQIKCIDTSLCFPQFMKYDGCSVCIKICPFNNESYGSIKAKFGA